MANSPTNNPAFWASLDPNNAGDLVDLQRKQMLAQMLMQQGLAGSQPTQMAGNVAIRQSPLEGLSRMFQTYAGNKMMGDYAQTLGYLNRKGYADATGQSTMADPSQGPQPEMGSPASPQAAALAQALTQGASQGSVGPTNDNAQRFATALQSPQPQPQPQPQQPQKTPLPPLAAGGSLNVANMPPQLAGMYLQTDPGAYLGKQADALAPTPEMKNAAAVYGMNSPEYKQSLRDQDAKTRYIAPVNARPGSILRDPRTNQPVAFNPHVPDNGTPVFDASGNVVGVRPLSGANELMQSAEMAKGFGRQGATPTVAYDQNNQPMFSTGLTDIQRANSGSVAPGRIGSPEAAAQAYTPETLRILQSERARPNNSAQDNAALDREISRVQSTMPGARVMPVLPPGANTAADAAQTQMATRFGDLRSQAAAAQSVTANLENIAQLAKTAPTGQFSDKANLVNALLGSVGLQSSKDANADYALLEKNASQIVTRLGGQGAIGTDAGRMLIQAANPNSHMPQAAINEAVRNLVGSNDLIKAKASLLSPHGNAKDPVAYQQKELAFDQAADPRIWQLKRMTPQEAQAYLTAMPPAVRADLQERAKVLKQLGVF